MGVQLSETAQKELQKLLDAYPRDGHPGTAVGVVNKHGEILFLSSTGVRDVSTDKPMENDTVFPIFSCTKVVCGIACMQAVERGIISLDEPLGHLAPELGEPQIAYDSDEKRVMTKPASKPITLRHLLTHTAGYTYSWYNPHIKRWTEQKKAEEFTGNHLGMPIVNEPGTKFEYGINMDWAGVVLERATGMNLDQYCKKNIFEPLGIHDSSYDLADRPDLVERSSTMHAWDLSNDTFSPRAHARMIVDPPFLSGGGGLLSTPSDFLVILATLLNRGTAPNGTRIYSEETAAQMFVNQMEVLKVEDLGGLAPNGAVQTTDPTKAAGALVMLPGQRKGWGLSFMTNLDDIEGGRKANSAEWGGVANLFWLADPASEIGVIIFNSVLPYGLPAFEKMEKDVQDIIYRSGSLIRAE